VRLLKNNSEMKPHAIFSHVIYRIQINISYKVRMWPPS